MSRFGPESDLNKGGHLAQRGPHIQLKLKLGQKRNWGKKSLFSWFDREREEKGERGETRLPPKIYEVSLVAFCQAKNESSSHRREVHVGTWMKGFRRSSRRGDFGKSKLSGL